MYTRLRNLILLAIVIIGVALFIRSRSNQRPAGAAPSNVQETLVVDQGDVALTVAATGPLQASQKVSLSFTATGKVASINITEGDRVRKGQTIAALDTVDLNDAVLTAQAKVNSAQNSLNTLTDKPRNVDVNVAKAQLNAANAQLYQAQHSGVDPITVKLNQLSLENAKNALWQQELTRDSDQKQKSDAKLQVQKDQFPSDVQENSSITQKDYNVQIAEANLQAAQTQTGNVGSIASAQQAVTQAQGALNDLLDGGNVNDVKQAQANLKAAQAGLDLAKTNLTKATLVSPFDGIVAQVNLHLGEQAPTGAAAVMLDTSSFYVDVSVDQTDVSKLAVNQPASLTFDALPGVTVDGKVTRIADTGAKSGNVVTYPVRVVLDPAGKPLLSSMTATVTITTNIAKNVVRVRNRFITRNRTTGKATVNVRQPDGTFKQVPVTLGVANDTYTEIKSGLNVGDTIAILNVSANPFGGPGGQGGGPGGG
jgi:RND family efflux transporter MFP subunit